ncbi:IgA peptidase M64-domain-containing protein [Polychytrium aggregatum]|uniref:IgA peptidase M64-domain-containing protein n=1 Tax=Polychytrium aggregatum TaxID=110093 RepID=UPI0022FE2F28|nr:IgA peptidase M64-domain-containing protein [Polychytrium aggregatum]KAI9199331.1 IgA peptidase M64-domain-containing protein [Polychytrium aggregatum]
MKRWLLWAAMVLAVSAHNHNHHHHHDLVVQDDHPGLAFNPVLHHPRSDVWVRADVILDPAQEQCSVVFRGPANPPRLDQDRLLTLPVVVEDGHLYAPHRRQDDRILFRLTEPDREKLDAAIEALCSSHNVVDEWDDGDFDVMDLKDKPEVIKLIDGGDPKNRIDVVLMGDGYTSKERDRFFDDMSRLIHDMWIGETFASVRPLFNIWAVYAPSAQSGIGVGGKPKDTTFGLYRDGTELRGIYCSKPQVARKICKLTGPHACDFPSLIANDEYYGGLGGEFTISTRSKTSGTVVLRHEMGHNFVNVGEEYDGGEVYSGCNAAHSLKDLKWAHWLTETGPVHEEENDLLLQKYPWYDLGKGPISFKFHSKGECKRWYLQMTASGVDTDGSMEVLLDGQPLEWKSTGILDRSTFTWTETEAPFSKGSHVLEVRQLTRPNKTAPIRQLCSLNLHEYADEPNYHFDDNTYVSAFPTFDINNRKSFRPTNEGCLMRNMTSSHFCSVCKEGLWIQFFKQISAIDKVDYTCSGDLTHFKLDLIPLAHLRPESERIDGEYYKIDWIRDGVHLDKYANLTDFSIIQEEGHGRWDVVVHFGTHEVRKDHGLLRFKETVHVHCKK